MALLRVEFVLEIVAATGTICCLFFYSLSLVSLFSFLNYRNKRRKPQPLSGSELPPVSILKPLKGVDPKIWESFSSHCEQDYTEFQLVFGVSDPADPAVEVVRQLQARYPKIPIELILCDRVLGTNVKVSNLVQMLPAARYEILIVNDSDIYVPPDYLRRVMTPLADPSVGLVTCLYRGEPGPTLGSSLEAIGINTDFIPGVLTARFLEKGIRFGLGSTLAFRRSDLETIGGFEALLDYLADDYELGRRIVAAGKRVELSNATVTTFLPAYTLGQFVRHQFRWSRTIRGARRWGYAGLLFTFGLPWAILTVLTARGAVWAWAVFAAIVTMRFVVAGIATEAVLHEPATFRNQFFRTIFLLPLRDLIAPAIWAASLIGNRIYWRENTFDLKDGRLTRSKPAGSAGWKK